MATVSEICVADADLAVNLGNDTQYNDLYLRANLGDTGTVPATGSLSTSPDIIPFGTAPAANPEKFFADNFNQDVGKELVARAPNYLYMRAKNLKNGAQTGKAHLYYSKAFLILYPHLWEKNALKTSSGESFVPLAASALGAIAVTKNPFTWAPEMIAGDHYCLIGRLETGDHPNPIPRTGSISDWATYIANNRGMGWRNVTVVDAGSPSFSTPVDYEQGTETGEMFVAIKAKGVPAGAEVAFSCGTPGPDPLINMGRFRSPDGKDFLVGVPTRIPQGFKSKITYSYWANGTTPKENWEVSVVVFYFAPPPTWPTRTGSRPRGSVSATRRSPPSAR